MSTPNIKDGKKPLSQRVTTPDPAADELFGSMLDVDTRIKQEIVSQGLEYRWIDAKAAIESGGYHRNGWTPYVRKTTDSIGGVTEFKLGSDPTGLVRRSSLVLAVRPKTKGDKHREFLEARAARQTVAQHQKSKADELKQAAKGSGFKTSIHQGYEEEES